jgi:glutathione S-transferase
MGLVMLWDLVFFEVRRGKLKSEEWEWFDRQLRMVNGVLKASNDLVMRIESNFLVGNEFSVAGIAIGAMLGMLSMVETQYGLVKWKDKYPKSRK